MTISEYIIFHALLIGASLHSSKGSELWPKDSQMKRVWQNIEYGDIMKEWRFKEIKQYVQSIAEDEELRKGGDDWWRFSGWISAFNRRRDMLIGSFVFVFDESMSAFILRYVCSLFFNLTHLNQLNLLRTTKTGGLPNLSFVKRKPEPLGTEFKNIVDGVTGVMTWLEIQEGKDRMNKKEFHRSLGTTSACCMRGLKATEGKPFSSLGTRDGEGEEEEQPKRKRLYFGDSWFGSVKTCVAIGKVEHHAFMMVKTAHARSPKNWLEEKMKDYPGGTWIVLEGTAEKGVPLMAIGYKYNKKKVLTFVGTRGAGSTNQGEPYEARFPDKYGNVCVRHVARPSIVSHYFNYSNCVDVHNQGRQFDLALEKKWVTMNPYFRLWVTILGMTVVDTWKVTRLIKKTSRKPQTLLQFVNQLVWEMMEMADRLETKNEAALTLVTMGSSTDASTSASEVSSITPLAVSGTHTKERSSKQLRCIWCSRVNLMNRKTHIVCVECGRGFCRDSCWSHHVAYGGVPPLPKRGTKKRKVH